MLIISTSKSTSIGAWLRNNGLVYVKHEGKSETELWNDKCWTREKALLQKFSNGSKRRNRKQSKSCWQISRQRRESSYLQVWNWIFLTTKAKTEPKNFHPADGGLRCGSWSGKSCLSTLACSWWYPWCTGNTKIDPIDIFRTDVEHLQLPPVWRSPDNTWETH